MAADICGYFLGAKPPFYTNLLALPHEPQGSQNCYPILPRRAGRLGEVTWPAFTHLVSGGAAFAAQLR